MRRAIRDERGFTLIEVLVAAVISLIVLSASMTVLITITRQQKATDNQNDTQQLARQTLDRMARQLRNLASPTDITATGGAQPLAIDRDGAQDLIFKDVDQVQPAGSQNLPNVRRVRYCLDATTPSAGKLYMQIQTWTSASPPLMPSTTACPGSGWSTTTLVAKGVTNGTSRPVFAYAGDAGAITGTDSTSLQDISHVSTDLFVDANPTQRPPETELESSVFLRNQNREPIGIASVTVTNTTTHSATLNGSPSYDPEGQNLSYTWYDSANGGAQTAIGSGVVFQYTASTGGTHVFQLKVTDPAGLIGWSPTYSKYLG